MQIAISPFALGWWAFWLGIVAVASTAAGVVCASLFLGFSSKVKVVKDELRSAEETTTTAPTEVLSDLERSADWTGKSAVAFTAAGAVISCLAWWFSLTVSDTTEYARMRLESEYAAKMAVVESDVKKAHEEIAQALADKAAANGRADNLEVEAADLRERVARAEDVTKVAKAQSEAARKEVRRARKSTAQALAKVTVANARAVKLEVEAAGLRERAARADTDPMEVKGQGEGRAISGVQRTRLLHDLKAIPKEPIQIIAVLGDQEAGKFAREMAGVLREAGWINVHVRRGVFSGSTEGFEIRLRDREKVPVFALQIAKAFDSIGFEPSLVLDPSVAEGAIELIIGMKPDAG